MKHGDKIKIHYTGTLDNGEVFDSSENREPLEFTFGGGQVIPGFENGVKDMKVEEEKTITIEAKDAYGESDPELVKDVPRDSFPPTMELKKGAKLILKSQAGQQFQAHVTYVDDQKITIDLNHPLAGKQLTFKLRLLSID